MCELIVKNECDAWELGDSRLICCRCPFEVEILDMIDEEADYVQETL